MNEANPRVDGNGRYRGIDGGVLRSRRAAVPLADELAAAIERARASYRDGRRAEAITQATQIEQEAEEHHSERLAAISGAAAALIGLCQRYDGDDDGARQAFTRAVAALRKAPKQVAERGDYAADLGVALAALSETGGGTEAAEAATRAERLLRHAIEAGENTPDVRCGLAVALRTQGQFDEAVRLLTASLDRSPGDWQAAAELARTLQASGAPHDDVAIAWGRAALTTQEYGPVAQAAPMFSLAGADAATDPVMLTAAGQAWSLAGRYDEAVQVFERAIRLRDDHIEAWLGLAEAHLAATHADLALIAYREALKRDPDALAALLGFAEIALLYLNQPELFEEAERCARRTTVLAPADPAGHVALGEALRLLGRSEEAAAALNQGIALLAPEGQLMAFTLGTRGQVRLTLNDLPGAISDLEKAAELNPGLMWLHRDLGTARLMAYYAAEAEGADRSAHLSGALDHLRTAVEFDPSDVNTAVLLADAQQIAGDSASAEQTLLAALNAAPDSGYVHRALGVVRYRAGQYTEALASVQQVGALANDADALLLQGQILNALDRNPEALASLEQAAGLAPDDPAVLGWLGETERSLGRLPEALAHLNEALRREPGNGWTLTSRGAAYLQSGETATAAADLCAALDAGEVSAFLVSRLEEAVADSQVAASVLAAWERAVERAPSEVSMRTRLGITYVNLVAMTDAGSSARADYVESACNHLALVAAADSSDPVVMLALGAARFLRGDAKEGKAAVRGALALKPTADTLTEVAALLHETGLYAEAIEMAEYALARQEEFIPARIIRGRSLAALQQYPDAELALSAVPEDQRDANVWATLGEVHRVTGHPKQAVAELSRADRITPDDAWTLASLGAAQIGSGQAEAGVASLRRAIELAPAYLFALAQLRMALADLGRNAEAVTALAAAADRTPDDADINIEYAIALGVAGRHRQALDVVDDVLVRAPDNVAGLRVAGWLLTLLGRKSDAVASYSRAVQMAPDDFDALLDLADTLTTDKQPVEALAALDRAAAITQSADVEVCRSQIFADLALWAAAIASVERALVMDSGNAGAQGALGWAVGHDMPVNAQRMHDIFRAAVALDDQDPWNRKELAEALLLLGRADEARAELVGAIELLLQKPPNDFDAHWNRGWCLFELGRHREAAEAYSQAELGLGSPIGLLADMGLNALVAGDEQRAQAHYERALSLAAQNPSPGLRGDLAVAVVDLHIAIELERLAEGPTTTELIRSFSDALQAHPLPEGITAG